MSDTENAQAVLSPAVGQKADSWLSDLYGGFIDSHTFGDIESALAGALESEGVLPDEAIEVVRRNGFGPFDRAVTHRLTAEAIDIARGRSGTGYI